MKLQDKVASITGALGDMGREFASAIRREVAENAPSSWHGMSFDLWRQNERGTVRRATMATALRELAAGLRFPEGPVAMRDGSVILVEIEGRRLTRIEPEGKRSTIATFGGSPNGAAIGPDGKCYVCNSGGFSWQEDELGLRPTGEPEDYSGGRIERVDLATGAVERLYDRTEHGPLRGPNDIVFDRSGGFWFTDSGKARRRSIDRGGVYYAMPDGSFIAEVGYPMFTANGLGLSPGEEWLYVAETQTGRIWRFELDGPGSIKRRPWPSPHGGSLLTTLPDYGLCDSLAVDAEGNICLATLMRGGITTISPDGVQMAHIPLPDRYVTNLCFGGPELRTAYVTLSQSGRLIAMEWPQPGLPLNFLQR
jgi:gluconolactonase